MGLFGKKRAAGFGVAVGEGAFAGAALFGAADSLASGGALSDVEFRHVCKAYGANEVLRRVTFTLPGGGVRCLMGRQFREADHVPSRPETLSTL